MIRVKCSTSMRNANGAIPKLKACTYVAKKMLETVLSLAERPLPKGDARYDDKPKGPLPRGTKKHSARNDAQLPSSKKPSIV